MNGKNNFFDLTIVARLVNGKNNFFDLTVVARLVNGKIELANG